MEMNQFDGNKSVFRVGAVRGAMPLHRATSSKHLAPQRIRGADLTHRRPGAFDPWTSSHAFADANASPCDALLPTGQNHPGQMVHFHPEPL
jgi:hypothetical protein